MDLKKGKHECPVCHKHTFDEYDVGEVCPICGWFDDSYQEDYPDEKNCENKMSLNEAIEAWENGKKVN